MASGQATDGSGDGHNSHLGNWGITGHIPNTSRNVGRTWQLTWLQWFTQDWQVYQQKLLAVQQETAILASGAGPTFKPSVICGEMSSLLTGAG